MSTATAPDTASASLDRTDAHFHELVTAAREKNSPAMSSQVGDYTINYNHNPYHSGQPEGGKWLGRVSVDMYRGFAQHTGHEYRDMNLRGARGPLRAQATVRDADRGRSTTTLTSGLAPRLSVMVDRDEHGRATGPARLRVESASGKSGEHRTMKLSPLATKLAKAAMKFALKR